MSGQHDLPESFVLDWMRKYEDKIQHLEELNADELVAERKRHATIFSDAQSTRIEEQIARALMAFVGSDALASRVDKQIEYLAGRQAIRFVLWVVCSFLAGSASVAFYYFKLH